MQRRALDEGKSKLAEIQADLVRVRDSKVAAQQVLEIGSIGGEFSELLRAMRAQLPETARLQRRIADRDQAIVDARLRRLQAEEARRALSDTGGMADRVLAANTKRGDQQVVPADVRPALEKLVAARRDLYVQLHDSLVTRIAQLAELNGAERDLLNQTTQLRALLNSRLLWLPSSGSIGIGWLDQVRASFGWIADLEAWKATAQTLFARAIDLPVPTALVLFVFGVLVAFSRRLSKRLARIAEAVGRYSTDNYLRTPEALLITGLLAVKTPLLFGYAGWLLVQPPLEADFTVGVGVGLLAVAYLLLFLRLIQFICVAERAFLGALRLERAGPRHALPEHPLAEVRHHADRLHPRHDQRQQPAEPARRPRALRVSCRRHRRLALHRAGDRPATRHHRRPADAHASAVDDARHLAHTSLAAAARHRRPCPVGLLRRRLADPRRAAAFGGHHRRRVPRLQRRHA